MSTLTGTVILPHRKQSLLSRIWAAYEMGRTRARLRELPDYMLADIGVTRQEAEKEGSRAAWDVPEWWRI